MTSTYFKMFYVKHFSCHEEGHSKWSLYEVGLKLFIDLEGFESRDLELSCRLYGLLFLINIAFTIHGPRLLIDLSTKNCKLF